MKVNAVNGHPKFGAIKVAKSYILKCEPLCIDVYELYREDRGFLQKLISNIDIEKMYPALSDYERQRWWHVLKFCVTKAFIDENKNYLATTQDKPCGIMTFNHDEHNIINLEGVSTIPIEKNTKIPFVGRTLFYQLFKYANENDAKGISLNAVLDGPFDVVNKYLNLGFKEGKTFKNKVFRYMNMYCNKHKIAEQLKELPYEINYQETKENCHLNLLKILV